MNQIDVNAKRTEQNDETSHTGRIHSQEADRKNVPATKNQELISHSADMNTSPNAAANESIYSPDAAP